MAPPKALVVDDDASIRLLVRAVLLRQGFEVETADGGAAALAFMRERQYDVIVLDLMMPGTSGYDVLESLAHIPPPRKCVVVISAASEAALKRAPSEFVLATLRKPFDIDELVKAVLQCLPAENAKALTSARSGRAQNG